MKENIPLLDISELDSDPPGFAKKFGEAYQEWGFAGITGHSVKHLTVQAAMHMAEAFFALPVDVKEQYHQAHSWARGYVPFGVEKAKGATHTDLKEFYHLGRENPSEERLGENIWPTELSDFRRAFEALYQELDALSVKVLQAAALHLELPVDYFTPYVARGEALLRILHYPPINDANAPNVRAAAHEDINLITLLVGSEQEGLEVLSRRGNWVPISMIEGTIICNVGDMLQRLSNGTLPSTTHRVVNPKGEAAASSRYSIPFFVHPEPSMSLACLPQCVTADHPPQYPPVSAGEYHRQRLQEIGLGK